MNKGILGFPRNAALQAKSVTAQTVTAQSVAAPTVTAATLAATAAVRTPGSSAANTGIKLVDDSDLGALFRPTSYVAVQTASVNNSGGGQNCAGPLSVSVSGSHLTITRDTNCNCNCDCTSCP